MELNIPKKNKLNWILLRNIFYFIFISLIVIIIITTLVLVIINFNRESDLQTQITENSQNTSYIKNLRKGIYDYFIKEHVTIQKFVFSKKYKLNNDNLNTDINEPIINYIKKKLIDIQDPSEFFYNDNDKCYIIQGKIEIKNYDQEDNTDLSLTKIIISYSITSNLHVFSAIKLVEMGLDIEKSTLKMNNAFSLCTNEPKSIKRCDNYIGDFYNDYYDTIEVEKFNKQHKDKSQSQILEDQLKGHYMKNETNENNDNKINYNKIEQSKIYLLIFFINENDLHFYNKTLSSSNGIHKDSLGKAAFIIEAIKV